MSRTFDKKIFTLFFIKIILFYCIFYFGSLAIIGFSSENGYYLDFVHRYLDYISILKISLLKGASLVAQMFGFETIQESEDLIRVIGARGVRVAISCLGIGVMSFWAAFTLSNKIHVKKKIFWLLGGLIFLWVINVCRIGLFLVSINKGWSMPFGLDHHTWFNIAAYMAIFIMIYFFEKSNNKTAIK